MPLQPFINLIPSDKQSVLEIEFLTVLHQDLEKVDIFYNSMLVNFDGQFNSLKLQVTNMERMYALMQQQQQLSSSRCLSSVRF